MNVCLCRKHKATQCERARTALLASESECITGRNAERHGIANEELPSVIKMAV